MGKKFCAVGSNENVCRSLIGHDQKVYDAEVEGSFKDVALSGSSA